MLHAVFEARDMMVDTEGNASLTLYMARNGMLRMSSAGTESRGSFLFVCILNVEK